MKTRYFILLLILSVVLSFGCSRLKKPEALTEREAWIESFKDSIEYYNNKITSIESNLSEANNRMGTLLDKFEYVSNPRQVTGYYILKGWNSKIPFQTTAIYARLSDDEKIELIATLSGGVFNRISVTNGSEEVSSGVVPHDQALNYRHTGYNTVCFSGTASDSVAEFISKNHNSKLSLIFQNGTNNHTFVIPENEKSMISETWELHAAQLQQRELQKDLWITSRKIDACRRMLENSDSLINK